MSLLFGEPFVEIHQVVHLPSLFVEVHNCGVTIDESFLRVDLAVVCRPPLLLDRPQLGGHLRLLVVVLAVPADLGDLAFGLGDGRAQAGVFGAQLLQQAELVLDFGLALVDPEGQPRLTCRCRRSAPSGCASPPPALSPPLTASMVRRSLPHASPSCSCVRQLKSSEPPGVAGSSGSWASESGNSAWICDRLSACLASTPVTASHRPRVPGASACLRRVKSRPQRAYLALSMKLLK